MMTDNLIHSSDTANLSLFQVISVVSDRAEPADWPRQPRLIGDIDNEPGDVLVVPVSMVNQAKGADGGAVGEDADSARVRNLSYALNIRRVDAASSMECPADVGGFLTSESSALDWMLDCRELALDRRAADAAAATCIGDGSAVVGAALNQAADDADADADSAIA
jgi:hypothetical protein